MYGLPQSTDLSFLVGRKSIQVCIGLHEAILNSDGGTSIRLECEFYLRDKAEIADNTTVPCAKKTDLVRLLGTHTVGVTNRGAGELAVAFSNGAILTLVDSNPGHESYQITHLSETIVV
jgi:hypothetical protein